MAKLDYDKLNSTTRYADDHGVRGEPGRAGRRSCRMWSTTSPPSSNSRREASYCAAHDVAGMRDDADFMTWTHAERIEDLEPRLHGFRRARLGRVSEPVCGAPPVAPSRRVQQNSRPGVHRRRTRR